MVNRIFQEFSMALGGFKRFDDAENLSTTPIRAPGRPAHFSFPEAL
jgi:hypothetical protein